MFHSWDQSVWPFSASFESNWKNKFMLSKKWSTKDVRTNCYCAPSLCMQIHTPCYASCARKVIKCTILGQMAMAFAWGLVFLLLMDNFLYLISTLSDKMKKIYRFGVWIFCKMHHRIPFFSALRSSVRQHGFKCLSEAFKTLATFGISIYTLSDLGVLSNLIGSLSLANERYSPPTKWIMRKPTKNKMAGVNSRFASVSNRFLMVSFWKCCWDHWVCIY